MNDETGIHIDDTLFTGGHDQAVALINAFGIKLRSDDNNERPLVGFTLRVYGSEIATITCEYYLDIFCAKESENHLKTFFEKYELRKIEDK